MKVEIDRRSGFCFGVIKAINLAEDELEKPSQLYCLGDIVHNEKEVKRLEEKGLKSISREEYFNLKNCKVLIRAHGEPPETYEYAKNNNIELIDATCPVVLTLQERVKEAYVGNKFNNGQVVIFGKKGHAEINGLDGQTENTAIIVEHKNDIDKIDFSKPLSLYSQTTKRVEDFMDLAGMIKGKMIEGVPIEIKDTICRQVSNRVPHLKRFVLNFDLILFVSGRKSSNGKYLFSICKESNENSHQIADISDIKSEWLKDVRSVGICGATSTPNWLMEKVSNWILKNHN